MVTWGITRRETPGEYFQFPKEFAFKSVTPLDRLLTIDARIPINIAKAPNLQSLDRLLG